MLLRKSGIKSKNILILWTKGVIGGMLFFLPILALYFQENLFSVTNVALIFSIESIAIVLLEVPTGTIADLFGRKRTIILAHFSAIFAVVFLYIGKSMIMFGVYALFSALAMSLNSGSTSALIYDTLKQENKEKYYKRIIGISYALWPFGAVIGSVLGGHLAKTSLSLPVLLTLLPLSLALFLTFFLKEPYYEKEEHKSMVKHIGKSLTDIVRNKQILLLFTSGFILFAFGESTHLLKSIFFEFKHIPVTYFGYIFGLTFGLSSLGHYFSHDVSEKIGNKMTLVLYALIFPIFMLLATQAFGLSAAVLIAIPSIVYGLRNPVVDHMLNLEVKSKNRATILSINSLVQRLGIVIFAPIVGYLADLYTINTAYMISAILMFSAVFLLLLLKDRK